MSCTYCGGSGWANALSYDSMTEMAFICSFCKAAEHRKIGPSRGARAWKPEDAHGFFLLTTTEPRPTAEQMRARRTS